MSELSEALVKAGWNMAPEAIEVEDVRDILAAAFREMARRMSGDAIGNDRIGSGALAKLADEIEAGA